MSTVFLSGSRSISRLHPEVIRRLDNIITNELDVVVGDANGADKAMQKYLAAAGYKQVTVFYVGAVPRNNVGLWSVQSVDSTKASSGWEHYAQKDKRMAEITDYGLVLWDGESAGSIYNVFELLKNQKKVIVFYNPEKLFIPIDNQTEALNLLKRASDETVQNVSKKISLSQYFDHLQTGVQSVFSF